MKKLIVIMCIFSASVMYGQDVFIETGLNLTEYNYKDPQGNNFCANKPILVPWQNIA